MANAKMTATPVVFAVRSRQLSLAIVDSLFLLADLLHDPGLFHFLPQVGELRRRLLGDSRLIASFSPSSH
jgi:hypothetical protein